MFSIVGALHPFSRKFMFLSALSPILIVLMLVANESHIYPDYAIGISVLCMFVLFVFFYNMDTIFIY